MMQEPTETYVMTTEQANPPTLPDVVIRAGHFSPEKIGELREKFQRLVSGRRDGAGLRVLEDGVEVVPLRWAFPCLPGTRIVSQFTT